MRSWPTRVVFCVVIAGLLAGGCGGSPPGSGDAAPASARPQGAATVAPAARTDQALQELNQAIRDAGKPVPHRKDFKVPASRAEGKTGLDLVNVVTDPMIDALSDVEDSRTLRERLNHQQYVAWVLFCLDVDISDGGLAEMYFNASGAFAAEAPGLLREAAAPQHAAIVEQANRLFAPDGRIPTEQGKRREMSHGVDDTRFAALDDQLMHIDDLDEVIARYIAAHRGAFFSDS
jgi:hypothetical protein